MVVGYSTAVTLKDSGNKIPLIVGYDRTTEPLLSVQISTTEVMSLIKPADGNKLLRFKLENLEPFALIKFLHTNNKYQSGEANQLKDLVFNSQHISRDLRTRVNALSSRIEKLNNKEKYTFPLDFGETSFSSLCYPVLYKEQEALKYYVVNAVYWQLFKTAFKLNNMCLCEGACLFDNNVLVVECLEENTDDVVHLVNHRLAERIQAPNLNYTME